MLKGPRLKTVSYRTLVPCPDIESSVNLNVFKKMLKALLLENYKS